MLGTHFSDLGSCLYGLLNRLLADGCFFLLADGALVAPNGFLVVFSFIMLVPFEAVCCFWFGAGIGYFKRGLPVFSTPYFYF